MSGPTPRNTAVMAERIGAPLGLLPCTCWCEQSLVLIAPSDVRAGRTSSCGRPECAEPRRG